MSARVLTILLMTALASPLALAADPAIDLDKAGPTPILAPEQDRGDARLPAANPLGPPTIPHRIIGHQLDLNANRCMHCHGGDAPEAVGATPLPESHRVDRDGGRHEALANARYPCTACHVPQARDPHAMHR